MSDLVIDPIRFLRDPDYRSEVSNELGGDVTQDVMEEAARRFDSIQAEIKRIRARIKIKGGTEDYPTQWAYDQACHALDKHKARAEALQAENARLKESLEVIADGDPKDYSDNFAIARAALIAEGE